MTEVKTFPTTEAELLELGPGPHFFPASFSEYLDLLPSTELRAEYVDDKIVLMSYASDVHEEFVAELIIALAGLRNLGSKLYGSNHRVFREGMEQSFAPDIFLAKKPVQRVKLEGKPSMIGNPWIVVEILSKGTKSYDLGTKLPAYKDFPSAEYILYLDSTQPAATLHTRVNSQLWRSEDFNREKGNIQIGSLTFSLGDVYTSVVGQE